MQAAAVLLGIAALGGLTTATIRIRGAPRPPTWLAILHGLLAASGVVLLIHAALTTDLPRLAEAALVLFLLAATGGLFINLRYHWKMIPLPIPLVIGHGSVAA